eukprot:COSAG01_NODE_4025_length_5425_cov_242.536050_7_plen_289_part_00
MPASASGQPLPNCGYLPARLQPLQTASQLIPLSPLLPVCTDCTLYEARADIRRVNGCIAPGTAPFADAATAGPRTSQVATCALRPPPPATFQRLGSGGSPLGAPHRGRLRCRLSRAWLFRRCLARRAAPPHGRRGRCGGQPRRWGGPGGCRAALCRGISPVSHRPRTRGTKGAAAAAPRSRRGAEALWQPAARCAPLGVGGPGPSSGGIGKRGGTRRNAAIYPADIRSSLVPCTVLLGCSDSSFRQSIVFWCRVAVLDPKFAQESESGLRSRQSPAGKDENCTQSSVS